MEARKHDPDNPKLLYQLSTVDNNNGHVLEGRGRISLGQAASKNASSVIEFRVNGAG